LLTTVIFSFFYTVLKKGKLNATAKGAKIKKQGVREGYIFEYLERKNLGNFQRRGVWFFNWYTNSYSGEVLAVFSMKPSRESLSNNCFSFSVERPRRCYF
jgi:hypothetical protein